MADEAEGNKGDAPIQSADACSASSYPACLKGLFTFHGVVSAHLVSMSFNYVEMTKLGSEWSQNLMTSASRDSGFRMSKQERNPSSVERVYQGR